MVQLPPDLFTNRIGTIGRGQPGRFRGVGGRAQGMGAHVSDGRGLGGSASSRHRRWSLHLPRGTAGDKAPADLPGRAEVTAGKCPGPGDGHSRPSIGRSLRLK